MRERLRVGALAGVAAGALALAGTGVAARPHHHPSHSGQRGHRSPRHLARVLLISVDGLHQSDLAWYVSQHPSSALARLASGGLDYSQARTPIPSDSFPGMLAQVTGGDPRVTGVFYDAEYSHAVLAPGSSCTPNANNGPLGGPVHFDETIEKNPASVDAGQGLSNLPGGVMNLTSDPSTLIDPAKLPLNPRTCRPIYPHQYLKVNTAWNVAKQHHLYTAWSDKHPAYDILQGPGGHGIDDLFTPEINSKALLPSGQPYPGGGDWTSDNAATRQYDSYKVQGVINEIDGYNHSRTTQEPTPAIFGMNFQTISTAQKLPISEGTVGGPRMAGGYLPGTRTPGPLLSEALSWLNGELAAIRSELAKRGLARSTAIILSAKHGQSPQDPKALTRIDDGTIIDAINAAWRARKGPSTPDLVADSTNDDAIMMWLSDRSPEATQFVANWLMTHPATGTTYNTADPATAGPSRQLAHSGLVRVVSGADAARYFGVPVSDPRHPDVWGIVQHGVVYTGGTKKIAEHGGANIEDRNVPIVVYAPGSGWSRARRLNPPVETTQIAPTILRLLGISPSSLEAVQQEGTQVLPGLRSR